MSTPMVLDVLEVSSGDLLGTVELTDSGELLFSSRGIQADIQSMARSRGWSPQETFAGINGWSNGYIEIVPAGTPPAGDRRP